MMALVLVDCVKDFFAGGKLEVPNTDLIRSNLKLLTEKAISSNMPIICFNDNHPITANEFTTNGGPFPPHCIEGTDGCEQIDETRLDSSVVCNVGREVNDLFMHQENIKMYRFFKNTYNIFDEVNGNPNVEKFLIDRNIDEVIIAGVVTEICVDAAVKGLFEKMSNIKIAVVEDAIMHLDVEKSIECKANWFFEEEVYLVNTNIILL